MKRRTFLATPAAFALGAMVPPATDRYVLVAWFGKTEDRMQRGSSLLPDIPPFITSDDKTWIGLPLWRHGRRLIYEWAIDYVACSDTRWVAFGPFTAEDAKLASGYITHRVGDLCTGYRLVREHCMPSQFTMQGRAYTDG